MAEVTITAGDDGAGDQVALAAGAATVIAEQAAEASEVAVAEAQQATEAAVVAVDQAQDAAGAAYNAQADVAELREQFTRFMDEMRAQAAPPAPVVEVVEPVTEPAPEPAVDEGQGDGEGERKPKRRKEKEPAPPAGESAPRYGAGWWFGR
jgi:deoxyribodipyrimidine photolyase